jgi:hypothetical protein
MNPIIINYDIILLHNNIFTPWMGCHKAQGDHVAQPRPQALIWQVGSPTLTIKWENAITARQAVKDCSLARAK